MIPLLPEADRLVAEAVDRGVCYFDVAPTYGDAQYRLGPALQPYRKGCFLACKTAIVAWLCMPLAEAQRQAGLPQQVLNLSAATGFVVWIKVSMVAALVLALPWVVYQIWKFLELGLKATERRVVLLVAPFSAVMTVLGILFLYYIFLPATLAFLIGFSVNYPPPDTTSSSPLRRVTTFFNMVNYWTFPGLTKPQEEVAPVTTQPAEWAHVPILDGDPPNPTEGQMWYNVQISQMKVRLHGQSRIVPVMPDSLMAPQVEVSQYLSLVLILAIIILISFQIPVFMTVAAATGLLDPETLARYRKYVIFGLFAACIFFTPGQDIVSNILLPLFLWGLFEFGLVLMRVVRRWRRQARAAEDEAAK